MTDNARVPRAQLLDGLIQLSLVVQAIVAGVAAEHDLSVQQLRLLGILRDREPGMQDLAARFGVDKSSMTGLVDRAESRGLVRRRPAEHDRRSVEVVLTPAGTTLAAALETVLYHRISGFVDPLPERDRTRLEALINRLVAS